LSLKLHQLECLVAIADNGGVRRASVALGRSAAAVSKAILELETELQAALLERVADGANLTDAGNTLLAHARLILGQLHRAGEDVMNLSTRGGGSVRACVTPWLMHAVLPQVVKDFRLHHPDVRLVVGEHLGDEYREVRSGDLDFAFGPQPDAAQDRALDSRLLFSYSFAVVCRQGHPAASARRLSELREYDWLLSRPIDRFSPALRKLIEQPREARVVRAHAARSVQAALAIVRSTDMLTVVPWPLIETPDMRDRFVALNLDEAMPESGTCLITRRYEPLHGPALAFLDTFHRISRELATSSEPATRRIFSMVEVC